MAAKPVSQTAPSPQPAAQPETRRSTAPASLADLRTHYRGPPSFTEWCQQFTRQIVGKTAGTLGPFLRMVLVSKFKMSPEAAEELEAAVVRAVEADAVATDEALAQKILSVFGSVIPHLAKGVGWGGVGLSAALALYEFRRGDGFEGIANAGDAAIGAQIMLQVFPALAELGFVGGTIASAAPTALFAAQVALARKVYEDSLISLNKGFRAQFYATRLPPSAGGEGAVDPGQIQKAIFEALPEQTGPDAAVARYAQAKAFNDFLDRDFLAGGQGFFGGGGHRDFSDYLQNVVPKWGRDWAEVVKRFYERRSQYLDPANEDWVARQMQTIALRFLEAEANDGR